MSVYRLPLRSGLAGLLLFVGSAFASAAEIEAGLPADTTAVLTVNLKLLLHAPILKQHGLSSLRQLCRNTDGVRETLAALGLDPFRDLDRLTVACIGLGEKSEVVYILRGRFDTARFHLAAKMLVKEHSDRLTMHKDENLKYISVVSAGGHGSIVFGTGVSSKNGSVLNFVQTTGCLLDAFGDCCLALLDKNTLVAATSEKLLKETCQRIAEKDSPSLNKRMRRLLSELDGKQTILFALRPNRAAVDKSEPADYGAMPPYLSDVDDSKSKAADSFAAPEPFAKLVPLAEIVPPPPPPVCDKLREAPGKSSLQELSGSISVAEDFTLRCTVRANRVEDAKDIMHGFKELRLRASGLMTFLAGSSKEYAFLKDIPRSFLAVRKGRVILAEGHLSPDTLGKLLETCSVKNP